MFFHNNAIDFICSCEDNSQIAHEFLPQAWTLSQISSLSPHLILNLHKEDEQNNLIKLKTLAHLLSF